MFCNYYKNKRVLVTGHTGFKGSWLVLWLLYLGADVSGVSLYLPSRPCNYDVTDIKNKARNYNCDIQNLVDLKKIFHEVQPQIVFHLAAQPIVRMSYEQPKLTFDTNVGGAVNILECIRSTPSVETAVVITSDKCYRNVEWAWGYRENDRLGGDDPYSASKACVEIVCNSYIKSFFSKESAPKVSTTRAGNVIGGGDWAADRIIPDCVRAFSNGERLEIRNPGATRPWQHVLEPLSGYLWLGANLPRNNTLVGESFNFGPLSDVNRTVKELIGEFSNLWGDVQWYTPENNNPEKKESTLLKLNCDKALHYLEWHAVLSFKETVRLTAEWYKTYYSEKKEMYDFSIEQINEYVSLAVKQELKWTR